MGNRGVAPLILNFCIRSRWVVSLTLQLLHLQWCSLDRKMVAGNRTPVVQPVVSLCIDSVIIQK